MRITSPPSRRAGPCIQTTGRNVASASARLARSPRLLWHPSVVITATSSSTSAGSSTKTASGCSSSAGRETTLAPSAARHRSYSRCCDCARATSIGSRASHVNSQFPRDWLTVRVMAVSISPAESADRAALHPAWEFAFSVPAQTENSALHSPYEYRH